MALAVKSRVKVELVQPFVSVEFWIPKFLNAERSCPQPSGPLLYSLFSFSPFQLHVCPSVFDSPLLALYIMSTHSFGPTTHFSSLHCSCPAQASAKRLILALRPSKLSQLSSFSPLSVSIWSNTLPGCRYGHQRAGWYFWPLCMRN